jgi:hypothetical protein
VHLSTIYERDKSGSFNAENYKPEVVEMSFRFELQGQVPRLNRKYKISSPVKFVFWIVVPYSVVAGGLCCLLSFHVFVSPFLKLRDSLRVLKWTSINL